MGIGDDVITLARARERFESTGLTQCPRDRQGHARCDRLVYQNSPYISTEGEPLDEYPQGKRPYQRETDYQAPLARFHLTDEEILWQQQYSQVKRIIVNPNGKQHAHHKNNKLWLHHRWQQLADLLTQRFPEYRVTQLVSLGFKRLTGVDYIPTPNARHLIASIPLASWIITTEGAQHHLAAAWHVAATVIYGHCTSPRTTGYPGQHALYDESGPCGSRETCRQCRAWMEALMPETVLNTVKL